MKEYNVIVQPEALREVEEIRRYQAVSNTKHAQRFLDEFNACLLDLRRHPGFQKRKGKFRHASLGKLPYRVVFEVRGRDVVVYQVRHTSQKPSARFGP